MREFEWLTQYFQEREWQVEGRVGQLRKSTLRAMEGRAWEGRVHRPCKARGMQAGSRVPKRGQVERAELA